MNQLLRTMNTDPADNNQSEAENAAPASTDREMRGRDRQNADDNNSYLFDPCEKPEDKKEDKSQR